MGAQTLRQLDSWRNIAMSLIDRALGAYPVLSDSCQPVAGCLLLAEARFRIAV
jgi:hypothetical protein